MTSSTRRSKDALTELAENGSEGVAAIQKLVSQHPVISVTAGLGIGFLCGLLLHR
jgi:ElaB/YqjD/DUF883 family membrane-anchored ribosome-binding protein